MRSELALLVTGSSSDARKLVRPSTKMFRVRPTTNWLATSRWLTLACTAATATLAAIATATATTSLPVRSIPIAAANAPPRNIASSEMFSVPDRSATHSPEAPKARNTANVSALM